MPLYAFAGQCHIQVALVFAELPPRLATHNGRRTAMAVLGLALLMVLYIPTGMSGFMRFGSATNGNVLNNFAASTKIADIARAGVGTAVLSSFPLQHAPARPILWGIWRRCRGQLRAGQAPGEASTAFIFVEAAIFVGLSTLIAILAGSRLSAVFQLCGALGGSTVVFTMPGLLWSRLGAGAPSSLTRRLPSVVMVTFGLFILVMGTGITIESILHPASNGTAPSPNATGSSFSVAPYLA